MSRTLIVILNFRTPVLTCDCLNSLARENPQTSAFQVVIVDNNSEDGSATAIAELIADNGWNAWAQLLALGE